MSTIEKELIDRYNGIEKISAKMIRNAVNLLEEERFAYLSHLQDVIIQFGELLEEHINVLRDVMALGDTEKHMRVLLGSNIDKLSEAVTGCEELCEKVFHLASAPESEYNDLVKGYKTIEGKLAILLRYDVLSDYDDEANDHGIDRAVDLLNDTSGYTGDYYPVHILINRLNRHYLPQYYIDDTAIILQGQIKYDNDFTLETLYRYRKLYPVTPIIVSTWKNEVDDDFKWCAESIGIDILENEYPKENGVFNINCQLVTSYEGIKYAKEKRNVKYALKVRSDQRFYLPDFLQYMKNEIKLFPLTEQNRVEARIILNGNGTSVWSFPFRLGDYWAFGTDNDLLRLYSAPHSPKMSKEAYKKMWEYMLYDNEKIMTSLSKEKRLRIGREHKGLLDSEVYIARTYYEEHILGRELDYDNDDVYMHYWRFIRDYTIIEDPQTLILYWPKYKSRFFENDCNSATGSLTHTSWLNLYFTPEQDLPLS